MKSFVKIIAALTLLIFAGYLMRGDFSGYVRRIFPFDYKLEISAAAAEYDLDPMFVAAVIKVESSFDENASSGVAHGLMQLTDDTAAFIAARTELDYEKRMEPRTNIRMGCYYISYLSEKFGNVETALAAYNAGPATVSRWLADMRYSADGEKLTEIPFAETRKYVQRIDKYYKVYKKLYG